MNYTKEIVDVLHVIAGRGNKMRLEVGMNEFELSRAEEVYGFRFPPDWREVLSQVLPVDAVNVEHQRFPDWRQVPSDYIQGRMQWPFEMLIWDVERNHHRLPGWSEEPHLDEDLKEMTRATLRSAPCLIPIYGHRFLPATPYESGNPIFSMHGTDTIGYGADLLSYFCREFKVTDPREEKPPFKTIPFWEPLARGE